MLELETNLREDFTIIKKVSTRAFSWLEVFVVPKHRKVECEIGTPTQKS